MKLGEDNANRQTKAVWILTTVLAMTTVSAALQTSVPNFATPKAPAFRTATVRGVLVSIPDRKLAMFENGRVIRVYRVAVGKTSTPSPVGEFKIVNRVSNPTYYHKGQVIGAGKGNPVGTRWMGLSAKGYGIHGTNQPNSIGRAASTGCIRMSKQDLEEFFAMVSAGDSVQIHAERDEQIAEVFGTQTGDEAGSQTIAQTGTGSTSGNGQ